MAKAKKTESAESTEKKSAVGKKAPAAEKKAVAPKAGAEDKKPAAKAGGAKKSAAKPAAPAQPAGVPMIDTNFAAQSAAKMLLNRAVAGDAPHAPAAQPGKESSTFKNLKDQLAKPKPAGLSHILGPTVDAKKSASNFLNQQRGHNQTQGGFNKTGVPRRTNG